MAEASAPPPADGQPSGGPVGISSSVDRRVSGFGPARGVSSRDDARAPGRGAAVARAVRGVRRARRGRARRQPVGRHAVHPRADRGARGRVSATPAPRVARGRDCRGNGSDLRGRHARDRAHTDDRCCPRRYRPRYDPRGVEPGRRRGAGPGLCHRSRATPSLPAIRARSHVRGPGETILLYLSDPAVSLLTDVPLALAGVGWLVTRNLPEALTRLGFVPVTRRQVAWAGVVAAVLVVAAGVLDHAEAWLLPQIYAREGRFSLRFANVSPWLGAPLVALAAGVGEEAVFRGALQPRFGVVLTALLFASVHVQYEVPGIALIFVIGVTLGILRERTSTTFTAVAHMLYDIAAFLLPDF
ncbi:MAG: hypothetical protein DMD91_21870 [Candidatus Rokuibacteriota bacterium]|nr:MAG: hypothetical protein DMD91_21870 [Candidatus Rokubacteria bacterium]